MTGIKVASVISSTHHPHPHPPVPPPTHTHTHTHTPYLLCLVVNFWKLAFFEFRCPLSRQWSVCQKSQVK